MIGVHTPEFAFEKNIDNVRKAIADLKIAYPVAIDNNYAIWRAFKNHYWPAHYFIDAKGHIRHHHFGEGDYDGSERVIQQLLTEAGRRRWRPNWCPSTPLVRGGAGHARGAIAGNLHRLRAGGAFRLARRRGSGQPSRLRDGDPRLNEWGLAGDWTIGPEHAALNTQDGRIVFRFHARDLHLVLGPGPDGKPVRFRVTIDGAAPGNSRGADMGADGQGVVTGQRLYQLVRQSGQITDRTFEIQFLDPGVQAYAFTFG